MIPYLTSARGGTPQLGCDPRRDPGSGAQYEGVWKFLRRRVPLLIVTILGIIVLAEIIVICFAAYKIAASSFDFTVMIWKLISLSIKIRSPGGRRTSNARQSGP